MQHFYKIFLFTSFFFAFTKVDAQIVCNFTLFDTVECNQLPIIATPTETSGSAITQRCWRLLGPNTNINTGCGNNSSFSYIATQCGTYSLTLRSFNANGDSCIITKQVKVACPPIIDVNFSVTQGCQPLTVEADCNIDPVDGVLTRVLYVWGCGGTIDTFPGCPALPIPHVYETCSPGCVSPTIIATNSFGCSTTFNDSCAITINPCPVARFTADTTYSYCANSPLAVTFTADSTLPNSQFCWYINGTLISCGTARTLNYTFPISANCYTVDLVVSDGNYSDTLTRVNYICVNSSSPVQFTQNFDTVCINSQSPATLVLTNANSGDLTWTVTGAQNYPSVTGPTASFPITTTGNYTLTALADYGFGCTNSVTQQVLVAYQKPVANFTFNDTFTCQLPSSFTVTATPCAGCAYDWRVTRTGAPPVISSGSTYTHPVTAYGTYNVRLTVASPNGCSDVITKTFVSRRINPQISLTSAQGCSPVTFTALDQTNYTPILDPVTSVCWSFPGSSFPDTCGSSSFPYENTVTAPGCFNVRLRVATASGCVDSATATTPVCVGSPPNCTLSVTPAVHCFGDPVTFSLSCDSFSLARVDYRGNNVWATVNTPTWNYTYTSLGTFTARVRVFYNNCTDSSVVLTATVTVGAPIAAFTFSRTCASGDTVTFNNTSTTTGPAGCTTYSWTYTCNSGEFGNSTLTSPRFVFPACDTCQVNLTATHCQTGCVNSTGPRTVITNCPNVVLAPIDTSICRGASVRFVNQSPSSNRTRWDFNCANGLGWDFTGNPRVQPFNTPGDFCIAMENRSQSNCLDTAYGRVRVCDTTLNFTFTNACYPTPICFNSFATDSFCPISSIRWAFGDGTFDTINRNPCHTYPSANTYTATLTVTRGNGCTRTISRTVTVAGNLNYSYNIDTIICPGVQQCITNNSSGTNLTFDWIIPNALPYDTFASFPGPCFTINTPGDYVAHFSVSSDSLCYNRDSVRLHVNQPAATGFASEDTLECPNPPTPITLTATSLYIDSAFQWFDNNGFTSSLPVANVVYDQPGEYIVSLTVIDNDGCTDTRNIDTIVVKGPYGSLILDPSNGVCACKDSMNIQISSVYALTEVLVYGCNVGSSITNLNPVGTPGNPAISNYQVPYCVLDTCLPQVLLIDTSGCQVYIENSTQFIVVDSPVVAFTFNNYGVCNNGTVCFQDATTYTLDSTLSYTVRREWDFGDGTGTTDSVANPCHYYANPGAYYPILRIWSNVGCYDSITTQVVVVSDYPSAMFYADDTLFCEDDSTCFHDSSTIFQYATADFWTWDFGDSSGIDTSYVPDVCHFYADGGVYRVTMCVYDSLGCPDCDSSVVITVISDPVADAGGDRTLCYGVPTVLNGSGGQTYLWSPSSFFPIDNVQNPTVVISQNTTVILEVGDQFGCTDTDTAVLTMDSVNAIFTLNPSFCLNNNICPVDLSTSLTGTVNDWSWNYGDNTTLTGQTPCHQYADTGFYTVTLTATDNHGCIDTASREIYLYTNPVSSFSLNDSAICSYQQLCVTDLSTSGAPISTWNWNYGSPGGTATGSNPPCYSYTPPYLDTYTVTLIIVDVNQCSDTSSIEVTFYEAPTANFNWNPSCEDEAMPLINTSIERDATLAICEWTLWLGSPTPLIDNNCNTSFQFPPGSHDVRLAITDLNGCVDTIIKTVVTDSLTQLNLDPGDTTICLGTPLDYVVGGVFDNVTWTPTVWLSDPNSSVVTINPLGNIGYVITAVNGVCDPVSENITIRTLQPIPIDLMAVPDRIVLGMSSAITSEIPGRIDSIVWNPDSTLDCRTCPNPVATPTQTTTYSATIYFSQNGITCTNTGFVTIEVLNSCSQSIVYLPNTFTPNGDGLNDVFMIRGVAATEITYFRVFDRWGKLVFESSGGAPNDPAWGWNGNDRGGKVSDSGVYVYNYEIKCVNGDVVSGKGNVTLIR